MQPKPAACQEPSYSGNLRSEALAQKQQQQHHLLIDDMS